MIGTRAACSRFQVITEGKPAWAADDRHIYYFDGLRFWLTDPTRRWKLRTSWQTPTYGWMRAQPALFALPAPHETTYAQESRLTA